MPNFNKIKEHLMTFSDEHLKKGKIFEHYCKWFLKNEPSYAMQLKNVWLWDEWPDRWGKEIGIDLVAETNSGKLWAIQAKAYDEKHYIKKTDIDSFLTASFQEIPDSHIKEFSYRLLIAKTNNIGPNAQAVMSRLSVGTCLLNELEASSLDWSEALDDLTSPVKRETRRPYLHQEKAVKDILLGFERFDRGQSHMACATGKTLVGLCLAEKLQSSTTLVLAPSITLVSQLYREWANFHNDDFKFHPLFVCSDDSVGKKKADGKLEILRAGFPVTTNASKLLKELSSLVGPKVIFSTYHSSPVIKEICELDQTINFDLVIADEAHHCAGKANSDFATITEKKAIRATRKLFMTATPRIFSEAAKKRSMTCNYKILSMDDSVKFGPVFHRLSFSEAIANNLLCDYEVHLSVFGNEKYQALAHSGRFVATGGRKIDARTLASQFMLLKAIKKYDLARVISFHNRNDDASDFVSSIAQTNSSLPIDEQVILHSARSIHGEMNQVARNRILDPFNDPNQGDVSLIANAKCLSEGVDIPILDAIMFVDPKESVIDIVQAVGRPMRKGQVARKKNHGQKVGIILIPVFLNDDQSRTIDQSSFSTIRQVVRALRAHDTAFAEKLDNLRYELGEKFSKKISLPEKFKIDVYAEEIDGRDFARSMSLIRDDLAYDIVKNCSQLSLSHSHPEISAQWHPDKNGDLASKDVTAGSNQKVWWKCPVADDHEWQSSVNSRVRYWHSRTRGCSVCSNRIVVKSNCLATTHPAIAAEWHKDKNKKTPEEVTIENTSKAWFICSKGHEWPVRIVDRKKYGCGVCAGKLVDYSVCLEKVYPDIAAEWHSTKNGKLTARDVTSRSSKKVWWKCPIADDHEWKLSVKDRVKSRKCSVCIGKIVVPSNCLANRYPGIASEWHPLKNGNLTASDVIPGSHEKVWWKCPVADDHEWNAVIYHRTLNNVGCPVCVNKKVVKSNCLATTHPEISLQWHTTKNKNLTVYDVVSGSGKKVWWKCPVADDHEWKAAIASRCSNQKRGCSVCSGDTVVPSTSLAVLRPEIASRWCKIRNIQTKKNVLLTPENAYPGSHTKAWWICINNKHHVFMEIRRRVKYEPEHCKEC